MISLDQTTHTYSRDGVPFDGPSVTQALVYSGLADFSAVDEDVRQRAMQRGSNVHWMTALHDQGVLNYRKVPAPLRPFRKAYLAWRAASGFVPRKDWIERSFISDLGYAGTIDRVGDFNWTSGWSRSPAVIDLKSGSSIPVFTAVQLALYAHHVKVFRRIGVGLHSDGTYTTKEFPISDFQIDLAKGMEAVRRWKKR